MKIAWIGCGVMGTSMLLNLKKGGHTVSAYNRTYEKAAPLLLSLIHISITILILYINRIRCLPCYFRQLVSRFILNNIAVSGDDIFIKRQIHTGLFDTVFFCLLGYHMISQDVAVIRLQPELLFLHVLRALLVKLQHCPLKDTANLSVFSILLFKQRCFLFDTHRLCIMRRDINSSRLLLLGIHPIDGQHHTTYKT